VLPFHPGEAPEQLAHLGILGFARRALVERVAAQLDLEGLAHGFQSRVAFDRTDDALPLPLQAEWVSLLPYVNHLQNLNWYGLKVGGLTPGKYRLLIDGAEVASFSSDELAAGVNLGNLRAGEHSLVAFFTGKGPHERDYKRGATLKIDKGTDPKYIELQIKDSMGKLQPEFDVKVWQ